MSAPHICSGERAALLAGEGDQVRCGKCGTFVPERDLISTDEGDVCPGCASEDDE